MLIIGLFLHKLGSIVVGISILAGGIFAAASENVSLVGSAGFTAFALTGFGLMWRSWRRELNRLAFSNSKKRSSEHYSFKRSY